VISTLRAAEAVDTLTRLLDLFPASEHAGRQSLIGTLRGVVSQRLLGAPTARTDGGEVLVGVQVIDCAADPARLHELERVLADGQYHGMQALDQALVELVRGGWSAGRVAASNNQGPAHRLDPGRSRQLYALTIWCRLRTPSCADRWSIGSRRWGHGGVDPTAWCPEPGRRLRSESARVSDSPRLRVPSR
jgi:hypothetical protein